MTLDASSDIQVGAEVTIVGTVTQIDTNGIPRYCVETPGGTLWYRAACFASVKNPRHPEPVSGYAVVDGHIAWRLPSNNWATDVAVYNGWGNLLEMMDPESVVELVGKV